MSSLKHVVIILLFCILDYNAVYITRNYLVIRVKNMEAAFHRSALMSPPNSKTERIKKMLNFFNQIFLFPKVSPSYFGQHSSRGFACKFILPVCILGKWSLQIINIYCGKELQCSSSRDAINSRDHQRNANGSNKIWQSTALREQQRLQEHCGDITGDASNSKDISISRGTHIGSNFTNVVVLKN